TPRQKSQHDAHSNHRQYAARCAQSRWLITARSCRSRCNLASLPDGLGGLVPVRARRRGAAPPNAHCQRGSTCCWFPSIQNNQAVLDISRVSARLTRVRLPEFVKRCQERFVKMGPAPRPLGSWIHLRVLINHPAMSALGKPDIERTPPNDRPLAPKRYS